MGADPPLIGAVVDGKYKVEALLGRGGMGAVYRAMHAGTDRTVALKVIAGALAGDPDYVERFRREARACGRLRHPGIVDVTDFGVATHQGQPLPYLVMECLDGRTLAEALREQPRPPLPWIIDVLEQVCAAVEEAHRHGILHRDLKPENVWLEPDRRGGINVKVLDFGMAKLDGDDGAARSPAGRAVSGSAIDVTMAPSIEETGVTSARGSTGISGTPAYMSPEQSLGEPATTRSDVYSLGVMAYRMITGRLPYEGSIEEVLTAKRQREATPVLAIRPDVHADAGNLIALSMSQDPDRRPASAGVFGNMLAAQLEPAGDFFTRALVMIVGRLSTFAKCTAIVATPMLALSLAASLWQLLSFTGTVPYLTGRAAIAAMVGLAASVTASQVMFGAMSLPVLHAMAAPSRPIDVMALLRANRRRVRAFLAGVLPLIIGTLGVLAMLGMMVMVLRDVSPQLRLLPRPARLAVVLAALGIPFVAGYAALRKRGLGIRETELLGSVLLIENLPARAAVHRSVELMQHAGGLRNAVQKRYFGVVMVSSILAGFLMGAGGAIGRSVGTFVMLSPLMVLAASIFLAVNAVINAMMYVSARRSNGESLERIYADLIQNGQGEMP